MGSSWQKTQILLFESMRDEGWKERVERWGKRDQWWGSWWVNIEWWEWEVSDERPGRREKCWWLRVRERRGDMVSGWGLSGIERKGVGSNVTRGLCLNGECYKIFNPGVIKKSVPGLLMGYNGFKLLSRFHKIFSKNWVMYSRLSCRQAKFELNHHICTVKLCKNKKIAKSLDTLPL